MSFDPIAYAVQIAAMTNRELANEAGARILGAAVSTAEAARDGRNARQRLADTITRGR